MQPQQVTAFPAEHMLTIVMYDLRPHASKHQIRVCACLEAQFDFFSRADSGVLLTAINAQVSNTTLSINQAAKNVARNQAAPSSRVSSAQDDPDNCFIKLQLRWKMLHKHRTQIGMFRPIRMDHTNCLQVVIKSIQKIGTQISIGSLTTTLRLCPRIRVSSPSGYCCSWWSSTFQVLQELNGPDIL